MSALSPSRRVLRGALATTLFVVGATSMLLGASVASATEAPPASTIPLHNATAETGEDCPPGDGAYWHFILAPNKGGSAFTAITLDLGSDTIVASGAAILPNGGQTDNVFVAVPTGHELDDLELDGSFATYTGTTPTKFNLSHVCEGASQPAVEEPPVEEPPVDEPPAEEPPAEEPVTKQDPVPSATVMGTTLDASSVAQTVPAAATAVTTDGTLPYTGSETLPFLLVGLAFVIGGTVLARLARSREA